MTCRSDMQTGLHGFTLGSNLAFALLRGMGKKRNSCANIKNKCHLK